ncbi:MAG: inner-rane translocator [Clostridiales bacterium]|jgi:simple sugar transport system permease protein|nr:inner-rane translocator [Clostridiales bacterium]
MRGKIYLPEKTHEGIKSLTFSFFSICLAFLIGAIIIKLLGLSPSKAYLSMILGSFGNANAIAETLVKTTPLIFTGLSYAIAKRCGLVNLGAEGQLYMGGFLASFVGIYLNGLPIYIHLPLAILAGFIGGGLWGLVAGWLKIRFGANEMITTIMLNYIAQYWVSYLVSGPMMDPTGKMPQSSPIPTSAILPRILGGTRLHLGIVIALLAVLIFYYFLWKTTVGYETRVVGINAEAARYAGIKPTKNALLAMFIAGGFAGLAGMGEILGVQMRMYQNFSPGYGFDGIAVALLGQNMPIGIIVSAILFGMLRSGANMMQLTAKVPNAIIYIIQALVIIFIVAKNIFKIFKRRNVAKSTIKGVDEKC